MKLLSFLKARNIAAPRQPDVVLGEDWVGLDGNIDAEVIHRRSQRGGISLNRSPLARKIITFNLLALIFLVAGVLFLNPFRDSLVFQREAGLQAEAELISDVFEVQVASELRIRESQDQDFAIAAVFDANLVNTTLAELYLPPGGEVFVFSAAGDLLASARGEMRRMRPSEFTTGDAGGATLITDFLNSVWDVISAILAPGGVEDSSNARLRAQELIDQTLV